MASVKSTAKAATVTAVTLLALVSSYAMLYMFQSKKKKKEQNLELKNRSRNTNITDQKSRMKQTKTSYSHLPPHIQREMRKEEKRLEKMSALAMKSPMYDNVKMLDPYGELLCTISIKKAKWYIEKNLASWTDETKQNSIKIHFEPKNRSNRGEGGIYVRSDKINQCVACGSKEYHMRHYVVPFAYRTLFPAKFKSHLSHDIVILCPSCQVFCDQQRQIRMKIMEEQYRNPEDSMSSRQYITDQRLYHLRSCALALLNWRHKLPQAKINNYETLVREYLNTNLTITTKGTGTDTDTDTDTEKPLTDVQLQTVIDVEYKIKNEKYVSGPELVRNALGDDEEKIIAFVKGWRQHFLDVARPKFLPQGWGVDSNLICGED